MKTPHNVFLLRGFWSAVYRRQLL